MKRIFFHTKRLELQPTAAVMKVDRQLKTVLLVVSILGCLYFFICSLSIFKLAFQLLGSTLTTR